MTDRKHLESELAAILREPATLEELHARITARVRGEASAVEHARQWAKLFPEPSRSLVQVASNDLLGRVILPTIGDAPTDVGIPPRWHEFPKGFNEFVWMLNRHYHWPRLLRAGVITGDARYAEKMMAELDDWIIQCPCPRIGTDQAAVQEGFNNRTPWRALEVGLRMNLTWPVVLRLMADSPLLTPERLARFVIVTHQHGRVLAEVSPILWPDAAHNHYLTENAGLLSLSVLLPELRAADEWKQHAWRELNRCIKAQLTPDGGQVEGSPHYHSVTVNDFCESLMIAEREKLPHTAAFRERLGGALDYALHSFRPSGTTVPWADGDATTKGVASAMWAARVFGDWTRLGVVRRLASAEIFAQAAGEFAWRVEDLSAWSAAMQRPVNGKFALTHLDRGLDQAMFRTDWTGQALSVFFGCHTPITPAGNGHAHIDPATFDFTALGRPLAVDPGRFTYREGDDRRNFKSAKWHNSLTIDEREPFEYLSGWKFGPQREGRIVRVHDSPGVRGAEALNCNFAPVTHRRAVALVADRALLVLDELTDLPAGSSVQLWFHLDSNTVAWDADTATARSADKERANVCVIAMPGLRGELLAGKVSDAMEIFRDSTRLKLSVIPETSRCAFATLLVPFAPNAEIPATTMSPMEIAAVANAWQVRLPLGAKSEAVMWTPSESLVLNA